jgi:hypothetical protein
MQCVKTDGQKRVITHTTAAEADSIIHPITMQMTNAQKCTSIDWGYIRIRVTLLASSCTTHKKLAQHAVKHST